LKTLTLRALTFIVGYANIEALGGLLFMKRVLSLLSCLGALSVIIVVPMLQVGCEEAPGLDGLTVSPSSVTLSTNSQVQTFAVVGGITNQALALPLTWSVSAANLGTITSSSGLNAIYRRTTVNGVNTITVRDQYDNEGYATVTQTAAAYSLTLTASPTSISVNEASTITITSTGSQAPYVWSLSSGPGSVTGSGQSAVYTSTTAGSAVITVTDANGASGTVGITIQDTTVNGGDPGLES
jgi:hypothetical protein